MIRPIQAAAALATIITAVSLDANADFEVRENQGVVRVVQHLTTLDADGNPEGETTVLGGNPTSCQVNPNNAAVAGIICSFSDLTSVTLGQEPTHGAFTIADDFTVDANGAITSVEWFGFMIRRTGPNMVQDCTLNIAPASQDNWTIRYYKGDGLGFPDPNQVVAEYIDPPVVRIDTGQDPFGLVSKFKMTFTLPSALQVTCGTMYHVEIYNNYTFNDCFFCWQPAPPGNQRSLQTEWNVGVEPLPIYNDNPADINDYDMTMCHALQPSGNNVNPPTVTLQLQSPPDPSTACCTFHYTVSNNNCIGAGSFNTFYIAIDRGDASGGCETIDAILAPVDWDVEFCENWSNNNLAIFKFTGSILSELTSVSGIFRTRTSGVLPIVRDPNNTIAARSVRAWASRTNPPAGCFTHTFGPFQGQTGTWGPGFDGICAFEPIPAMSSSAKAGLALVLLSAGFYLVIRSRTATA